MPRQDQPEMAGYAARGIAMCLYDQGKYAEALRNLYVARDNYKRQLYIYKKKRVYSVVNDMVWRLSMAEDEILDLEDERKANSTRISLDNQPHGMVSDFFL
jgi:hypothetical protein